MDSDEIVSMINKCPHLKFKFRGVFAADLFPILKSNCFIIVNASESSMPGSHWILLCYHDNNMYFADPLGLSVTNYTAIYVVLSTYEVLSKCARTQREIFFTTEELGTLRPLLYLYCSCDLY